MPASCSSSASCASYFLLRFRLKKCEFLVLRDLELVCLGIEQNLLLGKALLQKLDLAPDLLHLIRAALGRIAKITEGFDDLG